ncbi:MAG: hypothetical protein IH959_03945, partial [Chloroflexi bacterium]|nr:hypothetical protein [Chloroflexota bacterium]
MADPSSSSDERPASPARLHNTEFATVAGARERELQIAARGPVFGRQGAV